MQSLVIKSFSSVADAETRELTTGEYNWFIEDKKTLSAYLKMETIFDALAESYLSYKHKVEFWRLRFMSNRGTYVQSYEVRSSLNILCFNLLNISKLYLDASYYKNAKKPSESYVLKLTNKQCLHERVESFREDIFQASTEYVIGCLLRNKVQHSSMPIKGFTTKINHFIDVLDKPSEVSVTVPLSHQFLKQIKVPKHRIENSKDYDLTSILDGYYYSISKIHIFNRAQVTATVEKSKARIRDMLGDYCTTDSGYYADVVDNISGCSTAASLDWFEVASHLELKHYSPVNYANYNF